MLDTNKVFSGTTPISMQLKNSINRLQEILHIIETSNKEPEIYLQEQLFENELEAEYVLFNVVNNYGVDAVESFQIDFIQKVLKVLKSFISFDDISFETLIDEDGLYFLLIETSFENETIPILYLFPYFKRYEIIPNYKLEELYELLYQKENEINEMKEQINVIYKSYKNPVLFAGDNVKLYTQMTLNKKKREDILNNALNETTINLRLLEEEYFNIKDEISSIENMFLSINILRDRYIERLKNRFHYLPCVEEIENEIIENENLFENSLDNFDNTNKEFFTSFIQEEIENVNSNDENLFEDN